MTVFLAGNSQLRPVWRRMEVTKPNSQSNVYKFFAPAEMDILGVMLYARPGRRGATGTIKATSARQLMPYR
jgi:hypothetical protein